ncbi:MAG: outer membrane beta-barrel protein, partial [Bacteroidota bacterium]
MRHFYHCFHLPLFLFLLSGHSVMAQSFSIRGTVMTEGGQTAVEFATVMAVNPLTQEPISGTVTDLEGKFLIKTSTRDIAISIQFIGYESQTINDLSFKDGVADLGTIYLTEEETNLEEVVISTERSTTEFKLDKRVFYVGQDLSTTGASALEVLNNVPSVTVNIEGAISLRGSQGVQVLINGKPSVLASDEGNALGTITADMIEKVEVITNPGAKYEAEGTSGIINIILKKEEKKGLNGSISVNTGIPHNHSTGVSLNRRTEKFNLFSQFGVGYRSLPRDITNVNEDLIDGSVIFSEGREFRNENFYNIVLGADYYINPNNVITLSGNFAYEIEDQPSNTRFQFRDASDVLVAEWERDETTEATNPKWQYELNYKRDFKDHKEHDLVFSAIGNFFGKDLTSSFNNTASLGTVPSGNQETRTNFQEARYTFKLDYTRPFAKDWTLETGAQYFINDVSNDFEVAEWIDNEWVALPE